MHQPKRTWGKWLLFLALTVSIDCKKSPNPVSVNVGENAILAACNPVSGGPETTVTVAIIIAQNSQEVRVFGLELSFDSEIFQFEKVLEGNLTATWAAVDGNEVTAGTLRIGGFAGGGSSIPRNSQGALALVQLKVKETSSAGTQPSQICTNHYTDDIATFQPAPSCASFTLKK